MTICNKCLSVAMRFRNAQRNMAVYFTIYTITLRWRLSVQIVVRLLFTPKDPTKLLNFHCINTHTKYIRHYNCMSKIKRKKCKESKANAKAARRTCIECVSRHFSAAHQTIAAGSALWKKKHTHAHIVHRGWQTLLCIIPMDRSEHLFVRSERTMPMPGHNHNYN